VRALDVGPAGYGVSSGKCDRYAAKLMTQPCAHGVMEWDVNRMHFTIAGKLIVGEAIVDRVLADVVTRIE
jgi:hypothetical protein